MIDNLKLIQIFLYYHSLAVTLKYVKNLVQEG